MLQLREDGPLCYRMPPAQAKQLTVSSGTRGQLVDGPSEGSCTTMEEFTTGEEVLVGTFFLNKHPVIILFDSRASHGFISSTCAQKAMLSMVASEAPNVISTPRGQVDADRIVHKAPLKLAGRVFSTDLIILKGQGLDVIVGMSWMKWHRVVLDIAS
jgi:hypothetical protein